MSKPIFILRFPNYTDDSQLIAAKQILDRDLNDYHNLVIKDCYNKKDIIFECFNTPYTEIEFKELKNRLIELIQTK